MLRKRLFSSFKQQKNKRLSIFEKSQFNVSQELKEILIGLFLGDLHAQKRSTNTNLHFEQGFIHKDYIFHLYKIFKSFCNSEPKITSRKPDKRTGKIYTRIKFVTYSLPCFNYYRDLFYKNGKKEVPKNLGEILTPLGLAY